MSHRNELHTYYVEAFQNRIEKLGLAGKPTTHLQIGRVIAKEAQGVSFIPTGTHTGDWYVWDGKVHALTDEAMDEILVTAFIDSISSVAITTDDKKELAKLSTDAGISALKRRVKAELRKPRSMFDANRNWLVMANGYVLDTSNLRAEPLEPDMSRPVTRRLGVAIDIKNLSVEELEQGEKWQTWLDEVLPSREEQRYLQLTAGATLLGRGDAKHIVHLVGPKNTGKSTYIRIMAEVFGRSTQNGYSGRLPASALIKSYGGGANFAQSAAKGSRFLFLSEPSTDRTDDSFMKNLAGGGEPITTERKGLDPEEWMSECVLHIAANSVVRFDTRDKALSDRIDIVEFTNVIKKVNTRFVDELVEEEGDKILFWVIKGALDYEAARGQIDVPQSIKERAKHHVVESSAPQRWLQDGEVDQLLKIDVEASARTFISRSEAYDMYITWCIENGEKQTAQKWWLSDIHSALDAPSEFAHSRPGGVRRLYGVVKVSQTVRDSTDMENAAIDYRELFRHHGGTTNDTETAPMTF